MEKKLEGLSLPRPEGGAPEARGKGRGCHYLMETPDGELVGVWESELPAFLKKYGQKGQARDRRT